MAGVEAVIRNDYFQFALILLCSIIIALIVRFIIKKFEQKFFKKRRTIFVLSLSSLILLIGLYLALKSLSVLDPHYLLVDGIFFVVLVLIITLVVTRIINILISNLLTVRKRFEKIPQLFSKIVSIILFLIAISIILAYFKIEITPLIATLGIGALAIGLALQSTLANFFAGLHIVSDRPINIGDFIELEGDIAGYVEDIGWRSTRIETIKNTVVVVPNAKLAESIIINDSMPQREMAVFVDCGVAYESNLEKVEKVTVDVAKKIQQTAPGAVKDFEPFIRYRQFGDSNIDFRVILRVEQPVDKYVVTHEFIKALKKRYDKEKIEISWPIRKIYQRG